MKRAFAILLTLGLWNIACAPLAQASTIGDAIKDREDLSQFYRALKETGVLAELESGSYTVFAPTNDAFAKLSREEYPCFHALTCKKEIADILRNHIVEREYHLRDVVKTKGSLISISNYFIQVAESQRDQYMADGQSVVSQHGLFGSMLYKIDGLMADDRQWIRVEMATGAASAPAAGSSSDGN